MFLGNTIVAGKAQLLLGKSLKLTLSGILQNPYTCQAYNQLAQIQIIQNKIFNLYLKVFILGKNIMFIDSYAKQLKYIF